MPVTLYRPKAYIPQHICNVSTGCTCSVLATDVAKNLGLDSPIESVRLNGI